MKMIAIWNPRRGVWETDTMDLLSEHSEPFSATWPSSGTTRSGVAYELPTPALPTVVTASSSLPVLMSTPDTAPEAPNTGSNMRSRPAGLGNQVKALLKTPTAQLAVNGGSQHPEKRREGGHGPTLADEVEHLLPTPLASLGEHRRDNGTDPERRKAQGHSVSLADVARYSIPHLLPTPAAHDSGNSPENHLRKKPGRSVVTSLQVLVDHDLIATGGRIALPSTGGSESPVDQRRPRRTRTDATAHTASPPSSSSG